MSTYAPPAAPAPPKRYPLGLPPGSVRALLTLGVLALLWVLTLLAPKEYGTAEQDKLPMIYITLQLLMLFLMGHFFASHGKSIGRHLDAGSPLGLPGGTVRVLLLGGYIGLCVYLYIHRASYHYSVPTESIALVLGVMMGGYLVGGILGGLARMTGGGETPFWFQDVQAWLAILGLIVMTGLVVYYLFIDKSLSTETRPDMRIAEAVLAGIIGLYFGART
jgi:hypothetical protein